MNSHSSISAPPNVQIEDEPKRDAAQTSSTKSRTTAKDIPLSAGMQHSRLPPIQERLELFSLYETKSKLYLIGSPLNGSYYKILKIDRLTPDYSALFDTKNHALSEDYLQYDAAELKDLLHMIDQGNASNGGLKEVVRECYGIIGFVRFLQGYYMILALNRKLVGKIGGHLIYEVSDTTMVPITHPSVYAAELGQTVHSVKETLLRTMGLGPKNAHSNNGPSNSSAPAPAPVPPTPSTSGGETYLHPTIGSKIKTNENRYRNLFQGLDLNKNFYFCPTGYNLTQTLQFNMLEAGRGRSTPTRLKNMYIWNNFLLGRFYKAMQKLHEDESPQTTPAKQSSAEEDSEHKGGQDHKNGEDADRAPEEENEDDEFDSPFHDTHHSWSPSSPTAHLNPASAWCLNLVHGYFVQTHLSVFGHIVDLTLMARRSRFFAGTRYLKRGVNNLGQVANDIETEQILSTRISANGSHLEGSYTSYVQVRASIPLFWSQEANAIIAQPAIVVNKTDPLHLATRIHIEDLWSRYGSPLLVLNLVKQNEKLARRRESIIGDALGSAIEFLNKMIPEDEHKIDYLAWDFKRVSQSKTHSVVDELGVISQWSLQRTGVFHSRPDAQAFPTSAASTKAVKPNRDSIRKCVNMDSAAAAASGTLVHPKNMVSNPLYAQHRPKHFWNLEAHLKAHSATKEQIAKIPRRLLHNHPPTGLPYPLPSFPIQHLAFLQRGVVRSNCIDSLDRTNVAQFCIGKCALGYQLFALGFIDSVHLASGGTGSVGEPTLNSGSASSEIVNILLDLYEGMGDELSQQYGGSAMHRSIKTDRSKDGKNTLTLSQAKSSNQPSEVLVSIRRHIQNSFQDTGKQDAMNLFLGYFIPPEYERLGGAVVPTVMVPAKGGVPPTPMISTMNEPNTSSSATSLHKNFSYSQSNLLDSPGPLSTASTASLTLFQPMPHIWDLSSDYYLHNPIHLTTMQRLYEILIERYQKQMLKQPQLNVGSFLSVSTDENTPSMARRGGILLELGHQIYPNQDWWQVPIKEFESTLVGYLPDWLMSFPKKGYKTRSNGTNDRRLTSTTTLTIDSAAAGSSSPVTSVSPTIPVESDSEEVLPEFQPSPRIHEAAYYNNAYARTTLSSFEELLSTDLHKVHQVRILGGPVTAHDRNSSGMIGGTPTKVGYSSLIPRFLLRRNKAEDEEMDEEGEEETSAMFNERNHPPAPVAQPPSPSVAPVSSANSSGPRESSMIPKSWLDPSQRRTDTAANVHTHSQLQSQQEQAAAAYAARFDENVSSGIGGGGLVQQSAADDAATGYIAPGMLGNMSGSSSNNATYFAFPGHSPHHPKLTPEQQAEAATAMLCTEYLYGIGGRMLQPDSTFTAPSAIFPTPNERKLYHFLDHYCHIRVEHNLIVEPQVTPSPQPPMQSPSSTNQPPTQQSPTTPQQHPQQAPLPFVTPPSKKQLPLHAAPLPPNLIPGMTASPPTAIPSSGTRSSLVSNSFSPGRGTSHLHHASSSLNYEPLPILTGSPSFTSQPQIVGVTIPYPFVPPPMTAANQPPPPSSSSTTLPPPALATPSLLMPTTKPRLPTGAPPPLPARPPAASTLSLNSPTTTLGGSNVPLVFSHAPPNSSISIRNSKKAAFYAAYLRRGEFDAEFLASTFEVDRLVANQPLLVELEHDAQNEEVYQRYYNLASAVVH